MSKRDRRGIDYVAQNIYGPFMGTKNNPNRNRKMLYEEMYMRELTEFAINRFRWDGVPPEIDTRYMELTLFRQALCVFFYHDDYARYMALQGSGSGKWNMYQNPITFTVTGNTMVNKTLKAGAECIPIWANMLRIPDWDVVVLYSSKLADMEITIEIAARSMRMPFVFAVDDNQKQTMVNVWRQIMEGQPAIFGTEALGGPGGSINDAVSVLDTGVGRAKDYLLALQIAKSKMWNEAMTFLGINNSNQDKRERLVADEVAANDSQISIARNVAMKSRQYACEQINKRYGLSMSVSWDEDLMPQMPSEDGSYMSNISGDGVE